MSKAKHTPKIYMDYVVYPDGSVWSAKYNWRGHKNREMQQTLNSFGYPRVHLTGETGTKRYLVHKLMAELFLPPKPSEKHQIRHLDGNKENNSVDNLAWGTSKENADDREKHGRTSRGKEHSKKIKQGLGKNNEATARLIAAAPEMYEALQSVISDWESHGEEENIVFEHSIEKVRKALKKARGEL